jgi:hypothetical protein
MIMETWIRAGGTHPTAASQGTAWWIPLVTGFGGVLLGFLLKALADWNTGRRQEARRFQATALLVSDELRANVVKLEIALETEEDPEPLASDAYHRHELILAQRLPPETRDMVRGAYIHARVHRAFQVRTKQGQWTRQTPVVQEALDKAKRAPRTTATSYPEGHCRNLMSRVLLARPCPLG